MFIDIINSLDWEEQTKSIYNKTKNDVINALNLSSRNIEDFKALISPAAEPYLEEMAGLSHELTQKRFGKIIQLYLPLYLSNECTNYCVYCGFNHNNKIERKTLTEDEILKEVKAIKDFGYEHILLVTGEHPQKAGFDYLKKVIDLIKPYFSLISIEVQPLEEKEYASLVESGLNTVYIYQETYNKKNYKKYHPKGKKSDFEYRLATVEKQARAGVHKIGLGVLLGLEDWRTDSLYTAMHLKYLEKTFWKTKYSLSFPRLRPHTGIFEPSYNISDKQLVQLICAYRIFDEEVEISLSTRESENFRNNTMKLGVTSMSAGSSTEPGGYSLHSKALKQFETDDNRKPAEISQMIKKNGYEAVWKDWDSFMQ